MGKSLLRRGFKADAERLAQKLRLDLGKSATDSLSAEELAKKLKIRILKIQDLRLSLNQIKKIQDSPYSFSACTLNNKDGEKIIIHNEFHSPGRQQSNLMHEMAHILCEHPLPEARILNGYPFPLREYNVTHEAEAETLGGTLQVTREGLLWALKKRMTVGEIAIYYGATKNMINYRIKLTGVRKQLARWR